VRELSFVAHVSARLAQRKMLAVIIALIWINLLLRIGMGNESMHRNSLLFAASIGWLAVLAVVALYVLMQ